MRIKAEGLTGRELHGLIFKRVSRIIGMSLKVDEAPDAPSDIKQPVLTPLPVQALEKSRDIPYPSCSDQDAHAGDVPVWGFRLRYVSNNGIGGYDQAHWLDRCIGRSIPADDSLVSMRSGATIAIDWHLAVLKVRGKARFQGRGIYHPE